MVAAEDFGSSGVCEAQSCVQTSCSGPVKWSDAGPSLSAPFQHAGMRSGWHQVSGLSQRAVSSTPAMLHSLLSPSLTVARPSASRRSGADCVILLSISYDPTRGDNAKTKQMCHLLRSHGNLQRNVMLSFPSCWSADFCLLSS